MQLRKSSSRKSRSRGSAQSPRGDASSGRGNKGHGPPRPVGNSLATLILLDPSDASQANPPSLMAEMAMEDAESAALYEDSETRCKHTCMVCSGVVETPCYVALSRRSQYKCAQCTSSELYAKNWLDIILTALYNLELQMGRRFFHCKSEICTFIDQNWMTICPHRNRTPTWCNTVMSQISTHPDLFLSHKRGSGYWALKLVAKERAGSGSAASLSGSVGAALPRSLSLPKMMQQKKSLAVSPPGSLRVGRPAKLEAASAIRKYVRASVRPDDDDDSEEAAPRMLLDVSTKSLYCPADLLNARGVLQAISPSYDPSNPSGIAWMPLDADAPLPSALTAHPFVRTVLARRVSRGKVEYLVELESGQWTPSRKSEPPSASSLLCHGDLWDDSTLGVSPSEQSLKAFVDALFDRSCWLSAGSISCPELIAAFEVRSRHWMMLCDDELARSGVLHNPVRKSAPSTVLGATADGVSPECADPATVDFVQRTGACLATMFSAATPSQTAESSVGGAAARAESAAREFGAELRPVERVFLDALPENMRCSSCNQRRPSVVYCSLAHGKGCSQRFCERCLEMKYDESILWILRQCATWACPVCRNVAPRPLVAAWKEPRQRDSRAAAAEKVKAVKRLDGASRRGALVQSVVARVFPGASHPGAHLVRLRGCAEQSMFWLEAALVDDPDCFRRYKNAQKLRVTRAVDSGDAAGSRGLSLSRPASSSRSRALGGPLATLPRSVSSSSPLSGSGLRRSLGGSAARNAAGRMPKLSSSLSSMSLSTSSLRGSASPLGQSIGRRSSLTKSLRTSDYDISRVVFMGDSASVRIEVPEHNDIVTPSWRIVDAPQSGNAVAASAAARPPSDAAGAPDAGAQGDAEDGDASASGSGHDRPRRRDARYAPRKRSRSESREPPHNAPKRVRNGEAGHLSGAVGLSAESEKAETKEGAVREAAAEDDDGDDDDEDTDDEAYVQRHLRNESPADLKEAVVSSREEQIVRRRLQDSMGARRLPPGSPLRMDLAVSRGRH